jgi:Tfp pilus assembly protein PilZ
MVQPPTPTPSPPSGLPSAVSGFSSLGDVEPVGGTLPGFPLYNLDASSCQERCRESADCKYVLFKREPTQTVCWIKPSDCELKPLGQGVMCPNDGSSSCTSYQKGSVVQPPTPTPSPPSGLPSAVSGFSSLRDVEPVGGTLPGFPLYNLDASSCQERCREAADCKYVLFKRESTQTVCWIKPSDCELKPLGQGVMCPNDGSCFTFTKAA